MKRFLLLFLSLIIGYAFLISTSYLYYTLTADMELFGMLLFPLPSVLALLGTLLFVKNVAHYTPSAILLLLYAFSLFLIQNVVGFGSMRL